MHPLAALKTEEAGAGVLHVCLNGPPMTAITRQIHGRGGGVVGPVADEGVDTDVDVEVPQLLRFFLPRAGVPFTSPGG